MKTTPKVHSIKRNLVNTISIVFALIIFSVYISVDLGLDNWAEKQFDKAMINKSNMLKSLIKLDGDQIIFEYEPNFMPEFSNKIDPQYFQIWLGDNSLLRSPSLTTLPNIDLFKKEIPLNATELQDVILPNGDSGRATITYFLPDHESLNTKIKHPITLTIYESNHMLERFLLIVDAGLVLSFFFAIFLMRIITRRIITKGLKPLEHLNEEIKKLETSSRSGVAKQIPAPALLFQEIEPIRKEMNLFIDYNRHLINSEQQLTGDIAHELKTPLSEIISLTEVCINFPNDERVAKTYKQDVLTTALHMKQIVDNLLLLQKTESNYTQHIIELIDIQDILLNITQKLHFKFNDIEQRLDITCQQNNVLADPFYLQTILINLIDNALYYSPKNSPVKLNITTDDGTTATITVTNQTHEPLTEHDLEHIFDPLYQSDQSRTRSDRHGLGLSIVKNICQQAQYKLKVSQQQQLVTFSITQVPITDET